MSITKLIKGQQIRIDSHQRGTGVQNNWDNKNADVHMDKIVKRKKEEYKIKVPLNSNRKVTVNRKSDQGIPAHIRTEVTRAFSNDNIRKRFVKDIYNAIEAYNSKNLSHEQRTQQALGYIGNAFGLGKIRRVFKNDIKDLYACLYLNNAIWSYVICLHGIFILSNNTGKWKRFMISEDKITYKYSVELTEIKSPENEMQ